MRRLSLLFALLALLLPLQAMAAPQYQIELLLFLRDATPGSEYIPHGIAAPGRSKAVATLTASGASAAPLGAKGITVLPQAQLTLLPEAEALRRQGLRPLLHTAWRQPVGGRRNGDWLWLDAGPVNGLVRVSLGRFLHLDTKLALHGGGVTRIEQAHRRLRSGELHYIDNPGYGILVVIRPAGG